ncbi:GerAB/ArcD/ProY family transporter [Halalkalibacter akibai]|uniref:Spore germination protein GerKB n=1 Tax=Halalkalibacter akibai (strain ATCC 43226 / DSM 21942 / CIP 109018 / JCM 9157 / 1139) TaxID=1236973 RepID=W4QSE9_HALA3|nr:endospore germination permease [Halalkalibacter akibai]GAE34264.1 spore germination protein GerKB [Halalkalibacter akibai JCM 9157]
MNTVGNNKISLWQLFVLITIFAIGTAVVVGAGEEAKQDIWIAEIIATVIGVGIIFSYHKLLTFAGQRNLYEILEFSMGKIIGKALCLGYCLYFLYIASRNIRDFGELMKVTILPFTPLEVIAIAMMVVVMYTVYLGFETLARVTEIISPYIVVILLLIGVLLFISGELRMDHLLPVLGDGFGPILQALFPTLITFPYGEVIVFTVFMTSTSNFSYAGKVGAIAIMLAGILITYSNIIQITGLGVDLKIRTLFPLMTAAREIKLMDFFERVDILVVFILMCGIFIKVSVFFYAGLKGLEYVFNIPYRSLIIPVTALIPFFAVINSNNVVEHFEEGLVIVPYILHLPLQFGIPFVLFVILFIKKKKGKVSKSRPEEVQS